VPIASPAARTRPVYLNERTRLAANALKIGRALGPNRFKDF
jgi:hypothetical protein